MQRTSYQGKTTTWGNCPPALVADKSNSVISSGQHVGSVSGYTFAVLAIAMSLTWFSEIRLRPS